MLVTKKLDSKKRMCWLINNRNGTLWLVRQKVTTYKQTWRPITTQQNDVKAGRIIWHRNNTGPPRKEPLCSLQGAYFFSTLVQVSLPKKNWNFWSWANVLFLLHKMTVVDSIENSMVNGIIFLSFSTHLCYLYKVLGLKKKAIQLLL